jgi:hypothetical protein
MHELKLPIAIPILLTYCPSSGLAPEAWIILPMIHGIQRIMKTPTMLAVRRTAFISLWNFFPDDTALGACWFEAPEAV